MVILCVVLIVFFRLTEQAFDSLRLTIIVVTMLIKLILMPWYLQAYLDMAYHRTEAQKKEAGRVTNVEYQKKVVLFHKKSSYKPTFFRF